MTTTQTETTETDESLDLKLIEVVAKTKPQRVKASGTASRGWTQPRAWTMGGNVD